MRSISGTAFANTSRTHKLSNSTTADLWNALVRSSGKPVGEIAAGWTQQPGLPGCEGRKARRAERSRLTQERFTVHFPNAPPLEWKIPLTYAVADAKSPTSLLITKKTATWKTFPGIGP